MISASAVSEGGVFSLACNPPPTPQRWASLRDKLERRRHPDDIECPAKIAKATAPIRATASGPIVESDIPRDDNGYTSLANCESSKYDPALMAGAGVFDHADGIEAMLGSSDDYGPVPITQTIVVGGEMLAKVSSHVHAIQHRTRSGRAAGGGQPLVVRQLRLAGKFYLRAVDTGLVRMADTRFAAFVRDAIPDVCTPLPQIFDGDKATEKSTAIHNPPFSHEWGKYYRGFNALEDFRDSIRQWCGGNFRYVPAECGS